MTDRETSAATPAAAAPPAADVTAWLSRWGAGDPAALDAILPAVYDELRQVGRRLLSGERAGHSLSTTGLVHEAYVRLIDQRRIRAGDRREFFAIAAVTMRRILVDHARRSRRLKRGGADRPLPLDAVESWLSTEQIGELVELDSALDRFARLDGRAAQVVQLRFFVGLSCAQIADLFGLSEKTVQRDWHAARAWLRRELGQDAEADGERGTASPDAGSPDAVSPDAVSPDAVSPDAVSPDAVSPDAA